MLLTSEVCIKLGTAGHKTGQENNVLPILFNEQLISIIAAVDPLSMFAQLWLMLLKCLFQFDLLDHVFAVAVCKLAASLSKVPFVISENPSLLAPLTH